MSSEQSTVTSTAVEKMPNAPVTLLPDGSLNILDLGKVLVSSGFFPDVEKAAQGIVKVLVGQELGFPPMASVMNVHIVEGKPMIGAILMAAKIKNSGIYKFKVAESTKEKCVLHCWDRESPKEPWTKDPNLPDLEFTIADARSAGLKVDKDGSNWKKWPKLMLYWRCIGLFSRMYSPELFGGAVYIADELNREMDAHTGAVIDVEAAPPTRVERPEPEKAAVNLADIRPAAEGNRGHGEEKLNEVGPQVAVTTEQKPEAKAEPKPVQVQEVKPEPKKEEPPVPEEKPIDPEATCTEQQFTVLENERNNRDIVTKVVLDYVRGKLGYKMYTHLKQKDYDRVLAFIQNNGKEVENAQ